MNFRLEKSTVGPTLTRFYVKESSGAIVGTINVANSDAGDLLKHWHAPQAAPTAKPAADKAARGKAAIVAALKRGPRLSKQALLRS